MFPESVTAVVIAFTQQGVFVCVRERGACKANRLHKMHARHLKTRRLTSRLPLSLSQLFYYCSLSLSLSLSLPFVFSFSDSDTMTRGLRGAA
jgi:hypothetical protein